MNVLAASDLDRTLIFSAAALGFELTDERAAGLRCVEMYDGKPLSYLTERAAVDLAVLAEAGALVPVTTRTPAQYQRVELPGPSHQFAVCANGGRVLRDGVEDADYTTGLETRLRDGTAPFDEALARLKGAAQGRPWVKSVRSADDLFCYVVLLREDVPSEWVLELKALAHELSWTLSVQERKLYLVPRGLTKWAGVAWVAEQLGRPRVLAAGDSLLDADLLDGADEGRLPAHGELRFTGYQRDHVRLTASAGVLAGEEIAAWLRSECVPAARLGEAVS